MSYILDALRKQEQQQKQLLNAAPVPSNSLLKQSYW